MPTVFERDAASERRLAQRWQRGTPRYEPVQLWRQCPQVYQPDHFGAGWTTNGGLNGRALVPLVGCARRIVTPAMSGIIALLSCP